MKPRQLLAATLLAVAAAAQATPTYGSNLIVNGDAEDGTAGWSSYSSWSPIQAVDYGNNWVRPDQPGPVDRGLKMFTGTGAAAVGYQEVDFGMGLTVPVAFELSGWLGGWLAQADNALFYVQFLDADRGNATGLFYRESEGWLPTGTSRVAFWLSMERAGGGDNDGYADKLSFVLAAPSTVPEPSSMALLSLGLVPLLRRRAR